MRTMKYWILAPIILVALMFFAGLVQGAEMVPTPQTADFVWKPVRGESVPEDAFSAAPGAEARVLLCRVRHRADVEIGYIAGSFCQIGGDGLSRPYSLFLTLVKAPGARWEPTAKEALHDDAVALNEGLGPDVFACRVTHDGKTVVGMVREGRCSAGFGDAELRSDTYEVLVRKTDG